MSSVKDSRPFDLEILGLRRKNNPAPEKMQERPYESHEAGEQLPKKRSRVVKPPSRYIRSAKNEELGKEIEKETAFRLRNMLKLRQAHKWAIYEWFYSSIDKPIFEGENEFQGCLTQMFPGLKGRQLARAEWNKIRALLGRPRRCSQAFFDTERRNLECCRQKIRLLQLQQSVDKTDIVENGRPLKIPLILPVGAKVTALLHLSYVGLFNGTVVAFDALSSVYRVAFDNPYLGTKYVPDFEIIPRNSNMEYENTASRKQSNEVDSSVEQSPMAYFEALACAKLTLSKLRANIERLTEMNDIAELKLLESLEGSNRNNNSSSTDDLKNTTSLAPEFSEEFQRRYADVVIKVDTNNKDLQKYLHEVRTSARDLKIFPQEGAIPHDLNEMCRTESEFAVQRMNKGNVCLGLPVIQKLATVLIVASHLGKMNESDKERVLNVLKDSIEEVRSGLSGSNLEPFLTPMEANLNVIIANLTAD